MAGAVKTAPVAFARSAGEVCALYRDKYLLILEYRGKNLTFSIFENIIKMKILDNRE